MSDDLVKRLRGYIGDKDAQDAADRIEELECQLAEALKGRRINREEAERANHLLTGARAEIERLLGVFSHHKCLGHKEGYLVGCPLCAAIKKTKKQALAAPAQEPHELKPGWLKRDVDRAAKRHAELSKLPTDIGPAPASEAKRQRCARCRGKGLVRSRAVKCTGSGRRIKCPRCNGQGYEPAAQQQERGE